ncbi:D-lactate dehydrogenase [cytochrome], mitochondrial [Morella rubra]|uniref:D-lactate dehydrogenase (cytochrome) n=1 Tax=Morella rubra TaxID=262757 RepID=A0A6A1WB51_9ROSI|nr:D-lactate dehydrogenase [cytochrome], mitochondrial [Morella rubra]
MAFSSWFSRLRSSAKCFFYSNLRISHLHNLNTPRAPPRAISHSHSSRNPFLSLLPAALAASAGSLALQPQSNPSFCDVDTTDLDVSFYDRKMVVLKEVDRWVNFLINRGVSFGGKGSTEFVVKGAHNQLPQELIDELKAICQDNMTMDYDERSEEEVSKIVKSCDKHKCMNIRPVMLLIHKQIPIVPYGGATSIEGHILSPNGGVCIDMSLMKPGIGWMELNEYLEPYGLFFPLDQVQGDISILLTLAVLGPGATIGGMCATRCSGSLAVRYGTMRDNVISLKVVLANGDIVKTASRARKSAAGYDLTRLMIGSEGTLGVITEVTLRLQKIPQYSVVAMCNFPSIKDAADVAIATMLSGIQVSRVELLDEVQVRAINVANGKNLPESPTLMFEFIGTEAYSREQTQIVQKIVAEHNGSDFVFAEDPDAKKELWKKTHLGSYGELEFLSKSELRNIDLPLYECSNYVKIRKEALWACFAMEPDSEAMISDVCVPLSSLAELISRSKQELDASVLVCTVIAHAGDGNFHTVILFDPNIEEQRKEAERLNQFMVYTALSMEGTCTGEHGVGTGKMKYLEKELGVEALRTMKRIKAALDPNNIMNPGKELLYVVRIRGVESDMFVISYDGS